MNYKLLTVFLAVEIVEFSIFWLISSAIATYFSINTLNIFLPLVGADIIWTVVSYGDRIQMFIDQLFNNVNDYEE